MQKSYAITENLEYQVQDGKKLVDLSVSDTVSSISIRGNGSIDKIREVRFGKNVRWIGDKCFATNDTAITLKDAENVRHIGKQSFYGCSGKKTTFSTERTSCSRLTIRLLPGANWRWHTSHCLEMGLRRNYLTSAVRLSRRLDPTLARTYFWNVKDLRTLAS